MFEGSAARLEHSHLATIRAAGARFYELHVGYRFTPGDAGLPWRVAESFVDLDDREFLEQIAGWQRELGLRAGQMHGPTSADTVDFAAVEESERLFASNLLAVTARAAGQLEIPAVVVHPTVAETAGARSKSQKLSQLRRTVEERLSDFVAARTTIAIENLPASLGRLDLLDLLATCEEFDSPALGICLDTGHAVLAGWQPAEAVRACGGRLRCLHVHDNFGQDDEHLLPFDGGADWSGFVAALHDVGYEGTLNLEINYDPYQRKYASPHEMIQEAIRRVDALHAK